MLAVKLYDYATCSMCLLNTSFITARIHEVQYNYDKVGVFLLFVWKVFLKYLTLTSVIIQGLQKNLENGFEF